MLETATKTNDKKPRTDTTLNLDVSIYKKLEEISISERRPKKWIVQYWIENAHKNLVTKKKGDAISK